MIKINLVPQEILQKESSKQRAVQAGIVGGIVVVCLGCVTAAHAFKATRLEAHLQESKREYERLRKQVEEVEQLKRSVADVQTRLNAVRDLEKGRRLYTYLMMDLAATLPPDIWFMSVNTTVKGAGQMTVVMQTNATTSDSISAWMRNLKKAGSYSDPTLSAVTVSGAGAARVYAFTLTTAYTCPKI